MAQIQALWAASHGSLVTANDSAAFQVAIWEIVYENSSIYNVDVGSGNFTASDNEAVTSKANAYLATVSGSGFDANNVLRTNNGTGTVLARANVVGFEVTANGTGDYQDQIAEVTAAPAPPALVLFLSGFVPFWAFRRRLLKPNV